MDDDCCPFCDICNPNLKDDEMVTITKERYAELIDSEDWLNCLQNAGVDNWSGYDFARELYEEITSVDYDD